LNDIKFRSIRESDLNQVYLLLNQLKELDQNSIDKEKAWNNFLNNTSANSIVGILDNKIIAYGSVVIENKIRGDIAGHIEDIVVDRNIRKRMVGIYLIKELIKICKKKKCYRITLFCKEELINFYSRNGFEVNNIMMKKYLNY
tara:strand:+ start:2074 stop:2502 length:429 start_codon:yes stop_codon:yes gene_type:complete